MNPPMVADSMHVLEGCFKNLAAATTNEKQVLEDMVKPMTQLTETNQISSKTNAGLSHQLTVLQNWKIPGEPTAQVKPGGGGSQGRLAS